MKHILRNTIAATLLLAGVIQHASADIVTVTGDTNLGPTYIPFSYLGGPPDPANAPVSYQAFDVVTQLPEGQFDWEVSFLTSCEYDCVTYLYNGAFDPLDPSKNLMNVAENLYHFSALQSFLQPGKHFTLLVTGYGDVNGGEFSITAGGPANISISAVPEPSAGLMLLGGLAGIGALARRRARRAGPVQA